MHFIGNLVPFLVWGSVRKYIVFGAFFAIVLFSVYYQLSRVKCELWVCECSEVLRVRRNTAPARSTKLHPSLPGWTMQLGGAV